MRRLTVLVFAALAIAPAAQAAPKSAVFGLRAVGSNARGYFVYSLAAGRSQTGAVIVSNAGTARGTVKLFTADATTGHTTGTVYETDKKPSRVGSWVTLSTRSLTLAPGQHKRVPFTLHVPRGQKAGEWVGGIVAETLRGVAGTKSKQKASVQIRIRDLTIVAVQANVPGPHVVSFQIGGASTGGQRGFQQVVVHFANAGNVLLKPTGTATIFDSHGRRVQTLPFTMDTFLPKTAIDYPILLKKALAAGDYSAAIRLSANGRTFSSKPAFSVSKQDVKQVFTSASPTQAPPVASTEGGGSSTPWALIAAVAVLAAIVVLLALWQLLRRRTSPPQRLREALDDAPRPFYLEPELDDGREPETVPAPVARPASCEPEHYWEVAYQRPQLGDDGVWRFPHTCRTCGLEVLASDVADASAQSSSP
jgi:hypothetical protein